MSTFFQMKIAQRVTCLKMENVKVVNAGKVSATVIGFRCFLVQAFLNATGKSPLLGWLRSFTIS